MYFKPNTSERRVMPTRSPGWGAPKHGITLHRSTGSTSRNFRVRQFYRSGSAVRQQRSIQRIDALGVIYYLT